MEPALEIKMVRENLALAIAYWTGVRKGLITSAHLPTGRAVVTSEAGRVVEVFNPLELKGDEDLARCATNQVRSAHAFSVMHTHRALESVYSGTPLEETDPDRKAARCAIYLLNVAMTRDMLAPVWACPPSYRQRFGVQPISFVLDAAHLDGKTVNWHDFGGLEKYLDLLDYIAGQVEQLPERTARPNAGDARKEASTQPSFKETISVADPVSQFVAARCVVEPDAQTIAGGLYADFLEWCRDSSLPTLGQRSFGMRLTKLGFTRRRRGRGRHWWQGIGIAAGGS